MPSLIPSLPLSFEALGPRFANKIFSHEPRMNDHDTDQKRAEEQLAAARRESVFVSRYAQVTAASRCRCCRRNAAPAPTSRSKFPCEGATYEPINSSLLAAEDHLAEADAGDGEINNPDCEHRYERPP